MKYSMSMFSSKDDLIKQLTKDIEIRQEMFNLAVYFLKRYGAKCCDKTNGDLSRCKGCNYNRLITGDYDGVMDWVIDVKLK